MTETIFEKITRKNAEHRLYVETLDVLDVNESIFCFIQNALTMELANALKLQGCTFRLGYDGGIYFTISGAEIEFPIDMQEVVKEELAKIVNLPAADLLTRDIVTKQDLLKFFEQADQITGK